MPRWGGGGHGSAWRTAVDGSRWWRVPWQGLAATHGSSTPPLPGPLQDDSVSDWSRVAAVLCGQKGMGAPRRVEGGCLWPELACAACSAACRPPRLAPLPARLVSAPARPPCLPPCPAPLPAAEAINELLAAKGVPKERILTNF